jgi:hypothetical protein
MPVEKGKMPKKSEKEMIKPDNKRITTFCINFRPGRSASRQPRPGRLTTLEHTNDHKS